ncbi:MAG TPA: 23S rRNA (uracil(1939)-C(5))-methyltransferase RlmD [Bacteroidota bacterium]|nr:23S rRNA (uracil(1939)-C(5))-methyltransferase RlmD [Bacteroidota bacterium]
MAESEIVLHRDDELTLTIESTGLEGKSIARHNSFVVFVQGGVPGDVVKVRVQKVKKNYAEANILEVVSPSPERVSPLCKYSGVCGGCKWQHVSYEAQLRFKQLHVTDAFERIGNFPVVPIQPIIGSELLFFYRNKMEYSFSTEQWKWKGMNDAHGSSLYLGLHVPQRYDKVLDIDECYLQSQLSNAILNRTREFARDKKLSVYDSNTEEGYLRFLVIREAKRTGQTLVNLVTHHEDSEVMNEYVSVLLDTFPNITTIVNTINPRKAHVATGERETVYYGSGVIEEQIGKYRFLISPSSFFQTNTVQAERLYGIVQTLGNFSKQDVLYDLYCGTGTIGIFLSEFVEHVVGIESVESAIHDAEQNAERNQISNCAFLCGDLKEMLTNKTEWMSQFPKPTAVVIDPPRCGMHPKVVEKIIALAPEKIVYVSCNPATQARDVKMLCDELYALVTLQPVDMFPHTYHIENVALLKRKS